MRIKQTKKKNIYIYSHNYYLHTQHTHKVFYAKLAKKGTRKIKYRKHSDPQYRGTAFIKHIKRWRALNLIPPNKVDPFNT